MKMTRIGAALAVLLISIQPSTSKALAVHGSAFQMQECHTKLEDAFELPRAIQWTEELQPSTTIDYDARPGFMRFETKFSHDGLEQRIYSPPRLQHEITARVFEITTVVEITPAINGDSAGLFLFVDTRNFLRLERGLGLQGQGVSVTRYINGQWNHDFMPTSSTRVELRLKRELFKIDSAWRVPDGAWNTLPTTFVPWDMSLTGGIILHKGPGAPSSVADFDAYVYCGSNAGIKNVHLPIIARRAFSGIRGRLLRQGAPPAPMAIELRRYQPDVAAPSELVTLAGSNVDGYFAFEYPDPLPPGWAYYIRYRNLSATPNGLLFSFTSVDIATFTSQTDITLPDIELSDVYLGPPYDPQYIKEVATPVQFTWSPRLANNDSFRIAMFAVEGDQEFVTPPLGPARSYLLSQRPAGFETAPKYYVWFVVVDTPAGTGVSFNSGAVSFTN
jgi:hypothetical protein